MLDCPPDATGTVETLGYGELKAGSERAVAATLPGRCLIVRPGLIVGPHEDVGRLPWWLARLARGGTVIAPGEPGRTVRMTDARDLASWVVDNTRRGLPATINVPGPEGVTFGDLLTTCARFTGADGHPMATLRWVADDVLLAAGVQPWMELPMWAPDIPDLAATWDVSGDRALRTGMRYRPLTDTVHDTWMWLGKRRPAACRSARSPAAPGSAWTRTTNARSSPRSTSRARPGQPGARPSVRLRGAVQRARLRCHSWPTEMTCCA